MCVIVKHKCVYFTKLHTNGVEMYQERIKKIRSKLKLSVAKMAEKMGIPSRTFVSYESDGRTPSLEFLAQLCKTFNVNANWFITGDGMMFNAPKFEQVKGELALEVRKILREEGLIK